MTISEEANTKINNVLIVSFFISLFLAFYVGFRMPNLWSMNYYIPSLWEGFFRRSMAGTFLYFFGDLRFNYYFVASIQLSVLLSLIVITCRAFLNSELYFKIFFVLMFLSPFGGYCFHVVGYIDQLMYLTLFIMFLSNNLIVTTIIAGLTLFIHEEAAFTIIPLYVFKLVLDKRNLVSVFFCTISLIAVLFAITTFFEAVDPANVANLKRELAGQEYRYRADYYNFFKSAVFGSLHKNWYRITDLLGVLTCLSLGVIAAITHLKEADSDGITKLIRIPLAFFACTAPLALGFIGWDTSRWIYLSLISCSIVFFLTRKKITLHYAAAIFVILCIFTAYGHLRYFDHYRPRPVGYGIVKFFQTDLGNLVTTYPKN